MGGLAIPKEEPVDTTPTATQGHTSRSDSPKLLEAVEITKRFPGVLALDRVSFDLHSGEIHALVGENGAGKSTLMNVLGGVFPHGTYEGEILVDGKPQHFAGVRASE